MFLLTVVGLSVDIPQPQQPQQQHPPDVGESAGASPYSGMEHEVVTTWFGGPWAVEVADVFPMAGLHKVTTVERAIGPMRSNEAARRGAR